MIDARDGWQGIADLIIDFLQVLLDSNIAELVSTTHVLESDLVTDLGNTWTVTPEAFIPFNQETSIFGFRLDNAKCLAPRLTIHSVSDNPKPPVRPTSQYVLSLENIGRESMGSSLQGTIDVTFHLIIVSRLLVSVDSARSLRFTIVGLTTLGKLLRWLSEVCAEA